MEIAEAMFSELQQYQSRTGVSLAFQCCEHFNRALVVERDIAENQDLKSYRLLQSEQQVDH